MRKRILSFLLMTALLVGIIASIPLTVSAAAIITAPIVIVSDATAYAIKDINFIADTQTDRIVINGHVNLGSGFRIDIRILDPDKELVYIGSTTSGEEGIFHFSSTSAKEIKEGVYTLQFGGKEVSNLNIQTVEVATPGTIPPVLPTTVKINFGQGLSKQLDLGVIWDTIDASKYAKKGSFTVQGTVPGIALKANANITVNEVPIKSIQHVTIFTPAGIAPVLPTLVEVTYNDGTGSQVSVAWNSIDASQYAQKGTFSVQGTVAGTLIRALATINVTDPIVTKLTEVNVTTLTKVPPVLSETVKASYSNGSIKDLKVVWDTVNPSQYAKEGNFTVIGNVEGTTIKAVANVIVSKKKPDHKDIIAIHPVAVTTAVGIAPRMPEIVVADYVDGNSRYVDVKWDKIDPAKYKKVGTFTVQGKVDGTKMTATATVTVVMN